ncbi:hypothetical protein C2I36_07155 [Rhodobacteraceae bacterium WD3A24]|nr:hypothetical protein C2I36_07155 [Rhodobacteraceae bacterium WD3A24]
MSAKPDDIVADLLDRHGRTFAAELGIDLDSATPAALFQWLCAALLMSARISTDLAMAAARALIEAGWTTPEKMAEAGWQARVEALSAAGYARFDESTARMLGETSEMLISEYGGDLAALRAAAENAPAAERRRLKALKGIGDVGADIFLREVQTLWTENYPFADRKSLKAAGRLGLPDTAAGLAGCVPRARFPALLAALIRADLAGETRK